jgi:uncharacterized membrane protein (UPF0182 family)
MERDDIGADGDGGQRPGAMVRFLRPRRRAAIAVVAVGVPSAAAVLGSRLLTDFWWFAQVGHAGVFWRILVLKAEILAVVGASATLWLVATLRAALRRAAVNVSRQFAAAGGGACVALGCLVGVHAMPQWQTVMLWAHASPFGVFDLVHHRDVGYFVFTLPLLNAVANCVLTVTCIAMAVAAAAYVISGAVSMSPLEVTALARTHLAGLAALALAALAWRLSLVPYALEVSTVASPGVTSLPGADYVDVMVRIPAIEVVAFLTLLSAAALPVAAGLAARGRGRAATHAAAWPVAATISVALLSLLVVSPLIQSLEVNPQPVARERPELLAAIDATRQAWSLTTIRVVHETPRARIPGALRASRRLAPVQLWDGPVLMQRMRQLTSGTPYFRVGTPTTDFERIHGDRRPVILAERELDLRQVPGRAAGWADSHMVYTHGLGSMAFWSAQVRASGEPQRRRLKPLIQPRIYVGNQPPDAAAWVVVSTRRAEADGPGSAGRNRPYHYQGRGGIALSSWIRRAAFALRLHDLGLLLSSDITPRSRIIMQRDVIGRLATLARFIRWDPVTVAAVSAGRIFFIADGYTTSASYPQAEPARLAGSWVNYARPSVVATVDAFSGQTRLYLSDDRDPIARAWAAAFPGLFQPMTEFPPELRPHIRYPPALFQAQAGLYQRFHVQGPAGFASGADVWGYPVSLSGSVAAAGEVRFASTAQDPGAALRPFYRLAIPPGHNRTLKLLRTALYTPSGGQNVVAELDGWADDRGTLRLSVMVLPGNRVIAGPAQISRVVLSTRRVISALRLTNKETTDLGQHALTAVRLGTPRWLLSGGGVWQVQPLYIDTSGDGATRMLAVTVFVDGHAGIGRTVALATRQALTSR